MSDMQSIIKVDNLSKQYQIGTRNAAYGTLRDSIVSAIRAPFNRTGKKQQSGEENIWALKDVSFDVKHGEVVGVIGRNGAGKSTLLKILSRIVDPTTGNVKLYGRVGSLLEVGTGFHPELTGRENIYLNGAILGMKRLEIDRKFDEIVAFSEIEKFIDTAVKHYSSGMHMRLAFGVAAHLEPEILIVDEVLAVGDASFQKKCLGKMDDVAKKGRTVLFVSHNMAAVVGLCQRAIFLNHGKIVEDGDCRNVVDAYMQSLDELTSQPLASRQDRQGDRALEFLSFEIRTSDGTPTSGVYSGQDIVFALKYKANSNKALNNVHVSIAVHGKFDENLFHLSPTVSGFEFENLPASGEFLCRLPHLPLQPGRYSFNLYCSIAGETADWIHNAGVLEVQEGDFFGAGKLPPPAQGPFLVQNFWSAS